MLNDLLLLSGNDIPFTEAQIAIHQPSIKEIAYIGEENFYTGCELLKFSKDNLTEEDRINLEELSNFEIIMSIMNGQELAVQKNKACALMVLALIFPIYNISINKKEIFLTNIETKSKHIINNENYQSFLNILLSIFCLKDGTIENNYNPQGEMARRIANKFKKRNQKLEEEQPNKYNKKIDILSRYVSILSVGLGKDMNSLLNYTVYQLFDEFKRYELKVNFDIYLKAKLAGAKDLDEIENWMIDIHTEDSNQNKV